MNNSVTTCTPSFDSNLFCRAINNLRERTKLRTHHCDKLISQLKDEEVEILNAQTDRSTVVIWFWCRSQAALENIQTLYESNQLRDILFGAANIQPWASEIIQSQVITIDGNQLKKTVGMF